MSHCRPLLRILAVLPCLVPAACAAAAPTAAPGGTGAIGTPAAGDPISPGDAAPAISDSTADSDVTAATPGVPPPAGGAFVDRTAELGIDFVNDAGIRGDFYFPEINGAGVAAFDYDGDGDIDVYFVQSGLLADADDPAVAAASAQAPGALYRNELKESGTLAFTDVTAAAGLDRRRGYGQGVAAGDIDNDGDIDLYQANYGHDQLWRNLGAGTFEDITDAAGVDDDRWTAAASFVDYDRDGWLDLAVVNYTNFAVATHKDCFMSNGTQDYCGPPSFKPLPGRLFHNNGDGSGTFTDVTAAAGIAAAQGAGLGVVAADVDGDRWPDLLVANDEMANFLWMNRDGTRFEEQGMLSGVALNGEGHSESNMGVVIEDFDGDLDGDVFITHLTGEHNTLWRGDGTGLFEDVTQRSGLAAPSIPFTGFGVGSLDYDGDGWLDLAVANGAVRLEGMNIGVARTDDPRELYRQTHQLFRNRGDGSFDDASASGGAPFAVPDVGRGMAVADFDDDGDADLALTNNNGPARILVNQLGPPEGWLGLRLVDAAGRRDAYGAEVRAVLSDGRTLARRAHADGSYMSSRDPRVLIAPGAGARVTALTVRWPDGTDESWGGEALATGAYMTLKQGAGR